MGLFSKVLPMSVRLAFLYKESTAIAKDDSLSPQQKLEKIHEKEVKWSGKEGFNPKAVGNVQAPAICIGLKDMAGIFVKLNSPDDALRYINTIGTSFAEILNELPVTAENAGKRQRIFEGLVFCWEHEANAYAQKNDIERVRLIYSKINQYMLATIEEDPSNKRINDLYNHMNYQTFNTFINMANAFPATKQEAYLTCLRLLKSFDHRDPGNDILQDLIGRFH